MQSQVVLISQERPRAVTHKREGNETETGVKQPKAKE